MKSNNNNDDDIDYVRSLFFHDDREGDEDFDPNERMSEGRTALHWFAYYGDDTAINLFSYLKETDFNVCDDYGATPAHYAAWRGKGVALHALLRHGADPSRQTIYGQTIADLARAGGHIGIAEMMDKRIVKAETQRDKPNNSPAPRW